MEYQLLNSPEKLSRVFASTQQTESRDWETGQIIDDKYQILDIIAQDDHKIIHKVRHLQWDILLAVRSQIHTETQVQFFHQAERWVELGKHPNVVSAYYVQNIGGIPRLFVEYVKSKTLQEFITKGSYDWITLLDIAIQICWGMEHAHQKGLLHGDLRPSNIFLSEEGDVKITDFRSRENVRVEYSPYMPPEQFEKDWIAVPPVDIYAFGVILYELCMKELPFKPKGDLGKTENFDHFVNHALPQQPPVPCKVNSSIPKILSDLILKCLSVNVDERPRHFVDIVEKLKNIYKEVTVFEYPRKTADPHTLKAVDLNNRALSLLDLNQEEEAENHLIEAVAVNPKCTGAIINLHLLRLRSQKSNLAKLRNATQSLLEVDRLSSSYCRSQISLEKGGFIQDSIEEIEKTLQEFPDNKELQRQYGLLLRRVGRYTDAIEIFEKLTETEEPIFADIYHLGCCHLQNNKKKKALAVWEKWQNKHSENPYYYLVMGLTVAMRGRLEEAYENFRNAVSRSPEDFWSLLNLAEITAAFGQYVKPYSKATPSLEEAKKLYDSLLKKAPRLPRVTRSYQKLFDKKPEVNHPVENEVLPRWSYIRNLEGYQEGIHSMSLSPDGRLVLVGGEDPSIRIWEINSGECRNILKSHPDGTNHIAISHDGHFAVSMGRDNIIMVWDLIAGECVSKLEGHTRDITSLALTTTGYLVSGSQDRTLRIWDFGALACQTILEGHEGKINCVATTPDGKKTISGSENGRIGIWDIEQGSNIQFIDSHNDEITYVAVAPDGQWLISAGWDQKIKIYDVESGTCKATLEGHMGTINCIAITPDSKKIISGSEDKDIKIWEIPSGTCCHTLSGHTVDVTCLAVAPYSNFVVSGSWDHSLRVWDIDSGQCLAILEDHTDLVHTIAITPDERFILSGGDDSGLRIWCDLTTLICQDIEESALSYLLQQPPGQKNKLEGQRQVEKLLTETSNKMADNQVNDAMNIYRQIQTIEGYKYNRRVLNTISRTAQQHQMTRKIPKTIWKRHTLEGHEDAVTCIATSSDKEIAITGGKDRTLRIWDMEKGTCLNTLEGHEDTIHYIDISPNNRFIVSGSQDNTLRLWELETGRCIYKLEGHKHWVEFLKFTQDGRRIISASRDTTLRIWERKTGYRLYSLTEHTDLISAMKMSNDGNYLITGSHDRTVRVWELESGQCLHTLEKHSEHVKCITCIPNTSWIISGGWDAAMHIWDIHSGENIRSFTGHTSWINDIQVTSDGKRAISCSLDKTIQVWDIETGENLAVLNGHTQDVNHISVTDDGMFCISSSWDNTLRVWDLNEYKCCEILEGHSDIVTALQATQNHRYLLTGGKDCKLIVWEFDWNWE